MRDPTRSKLGHTKPCLRARGDPWQVSPERFYGDTTESVMRKHWENADMERFCKENGHQ